MPKTPLGELTEYLTLQADSAVSDGQGGRNLTPATLANVYGAVRALGGAESLQGGAVGSFVSYQVEIVYRADITPKRTRVLWTPYLGTLGMQKTLEVLTVAPKDGRNDRLLLTCQEVA